VKLVCPLRDELTFLTLKGGLALSSAIVSTVLPMEGIVLDQSGGDDARVVLGLLGISFVASLSMCSAVVTNETLVASRVWGIDCVVWGRMARGK